MDDRIRVSDADRDHVTARLRDHFAEGRLTPVELDERISAALNATTFGDLRRVMADLPGPVPVPPAAAQRRQGARPPAPGSGDPGDSSQATRMPCGPSSRAGHRHCRERPHVRLRSRGRGVT